jgi:chromosome segregation ATPase
MEILRRFPDSNVVPQIPVRINTAVDGALTKTEASVAEETRKQTMAEIEAAGLPSSPEAEVLLQQADRQRISGVFDEAVPAYFRILEDYPGTKQASEVPQKLLAAVDGLVDKLQSESGELQQQLTEAETAVQSLEAEKARLESEKEEAQSRLASLQTQVEELEAELETASTAEEESGAASAAEGRVSAEANEETLRELESARTEIGRLETRISELESEIGGLEGDIEGQQQLIEEQENAIAERDRLLEEQQAAADEFRSEAEGEISRLSEYEEAYNVLRERYGQYGEREEAILSESDRPDLLAAKLELDKFLASDIVREVFPGLIERLKRYDRAFEEAGRETVAQEVIEIVYDMSFFETEREREDFLEEEKERYIDDPMMLDLIDELIALVNA